MADKTRGGAAVGGGADVSALGPQMVASLLGILQGATSPDAMEAQNILLRRLALQGDVVPSRVPAPRNITEIGGYFNLLQTLQQPDMLSQVLAAILGVAGPTPALGWISNNQPLAFLQMTNDRPAGHAPGHAILDRAGAQRPLRSTAGSDQDPARSGRHTAPDVYTISSASCGAWRNSSG